MLAALSGALPMGRIEETGLGSEPGLPGIVGEHEGSSVIKDDSTSAFITKALPVSRWHAVQWQQ